MPEWKALLRAHLERLGLPPGQEAEIVEELSIHAEDRYRELRQSGVPEADAQRLVLDELTGGETRLTDGLREVARVDTSPAASAGPPGWWGASVWQDVRFGFRVLRNNPKFTLVALLTLALGIGSSTAMFSVVNSVLLQPLRYRESDRLFKIFETTPEFRSMSVSYPNYLDWRRENHSFADIGLYRNDDFNYTGAGDPERLAGLHVSASLPSVLGVTPALGRTFRAEEDRPGAACTVMLSYPYWQRRFAGEPAVLGRQMTLNAVSCTVIGIWPETFRLSSEADVYVPVEQWKSVQLRLRDSHPGINVVGRLKPGVRMEDARAELASLADRLARQYPASNAAHSAGLVALKDDLVLYIRPTLLLLTGAVGFVLLIACANVANLLLSRAMARRREFAVRAALGAERWRLVRQLLTESVLLSAAAAMLGLAAAGWGTRLALAAAPGILPRSGEVSIDGYVLAFALLVAVATGLLFGLAPALRPTKSTNLQQALREGTRGAGGGRHRGEGMFVAVQIGLAVVLLSGAGLVVQSVWRLLQVNPGFAMHNLLTMQIALSPQVVANPAKIRTAYQQMLERVEATPGVKSVAMTSLVPLGDNDSENSFWVGTGPQPPQERLSSAISYIVTPGYAKAMQIPLRQGRFLDDRDTLAVTPVVVVDEVLAKHFFANGDAVGQRVSLMGLGAAQIVGVVGHVKQWGLDSDDTHNIRDQMYFSLFQVPDQYMADGTTGLTLLVRTEQEPLSLVRSVSAQVSGPTRDQPVYAVRTMEQIVARSMAERRFLMCLLVVFGLTALVLAAVGIYGVVSNAVTRRTNELGVRAALGASPGEIVALVLRQGMRPVVIGMAAGLLAAGVLARFLAARLQLFGGAGLNDAAMLLAVTVALGGIAMLASYVPARRATKIDPVVALRCE